MDLPTMSGRGLTGGRGENSSGVLKMVVKPWSVADIYILTIKIKKKMKKKKRPA